MKNDKPTAKLTIVTPTYEKHYRQFSAMLTSIKENCTDLDNIVFHVVIEDDNRELFKTLLDKHEVSYRLISTEGAMGHFGVEEQPGVFLSRVGKFTFQSIKKFAGLLQAETDWSLVLDSEGLFIKPFSFVEMLENYATQKYVFYTRTGPRGPLWRNSTGYEVTRNCGDILNVSSGDRWYMEYFHWFYETSKVRDLLESKVGTQFRKRLANKAERPGDLFENILYYLYLEKYHSSEYDFIDFKELLNEVLPSEIGRRFELGELPFSLFGNEYLLNIFRPEEIGHLAPLFERFKLPFVRLEPPYFSPAYVAALAKLPHFVATISSHHLLWMRKKVAVCISGEFRHILHRVPEHQVRHMLGFLSGVDCDVFIHGWSNASEALIIDQLKPKRYLFEPKPSFADLESRIKTHEPNIKPGRDAGSLAMFYGIQRVFELAEESIEDYDFVVRIRPDIYFDGSLKEIMVAISDVGDFQAGTIYFPRHFHSKGINDQFALGPVAEMATYCKTFDYVKENAEKLFFNPESVLLRNLLDHEVGIAVLEMRYALLRHEAFRAPSIAHHMHHQEFVWWSRTDPLPAFQDLSNYFRDKLKSIDGMMRGDVENVMFFETKSKDESGDPVLVRCAVIDNDPSWAASSFRERLGPMKIVPFFVRKGKIEEDNIPPRTLFIFREGDVLKISQWHGEGPQFRNDTVEVPMSSVTMGRSPSPKKTSRAFAWREFQERCERMAVMGPVMTRARRVLKRVGFV